MIRDYCAFFLKFFTSLIIIIAGFALPISMAKSLSSFIPDGHYLQNFIKVDLNQDGRTDYLLFTKAMRLDALEENQHGQLVDRNRRGMLALIATNNGYQQIAENLTIFDSEFEAGGVYFAPDLSVDVYNNEITFFYGHGRYGYWFYTFTLQDHSLKLTKFEDHSNRGPDPLSIISVDYLTKQVIYARNITEDQFDEKWIERRKTIPDLPLLDIQDITTIHDSAIFEITHEVNLDFED
ncbi:hypothetical protein [Ignatzschineria sp. LJL83]